MWPDGAKESSNEAATDHDMPRELTNFICWGTPLHGRCCVAARDAGLRLGE